MKVAILTSPDQWFVPYARYLQSQIDGAMLFFNHQEIDNPFETLFILSYHRIIEKEHLRKHGHNLVVHESDLPAGKGWAPLFWQILEGKNKIPVTLFEASAHVDQGNIYLRDYIKLNGCELHDEIRKIQAEKTIELCMRFIKEYPLKPLPQKGKQNFYSKRTSEHSRLDIHKSIKEQFNLLRIVSNDDYPAFFDIGEHRYILKIYKGLEDGATYFKTSN